MNRQLVRQHGERSLSLCFVAQDWELGATVLQKIQESVPGFLEKVLTDKGDSRWYNMVYIAAIEEHSGNLESSFRWLIKALDIIETSRSRLTDVADRRELLNVIQSAELFAGLARVSLRLSASPVPGRRLEGLQTDHWTYHGPTWADEALAFLEQGRARALLDLFTLEEPSQERYLEWLHDLRKQECDMRDGKITETGGAGHDSDLAAYVERLRSSLGEEMQSPSRAMILNQLHRPHFAADTGALYEAIPEDALAIHMNPSRDGVLVLYISSKGVELARPSSFTDQQMEAHVLQYVKLFKIKKGNMNSLPPRAKCQAPLEDLSDDILRPALRLIDSKSHLIFVPSQSLNKLPFSALLLHGEPLFMRKEVSMAPSLSVLQHLVRNRTRDGTCPSRTPLRATVVYKAPTGPPEKWLECSAAAAIEIAGRLGCSPKQAHKLDLGAFKEAYTTSDLIVICTHGLPRKAPLSAWESSIELQTNLPVLELVPLRSRAALVVFQACVSGVGESSLGNDVLGFAHSVLASGAGAFVGALWNVSDLASAMLMAFLFREVTATQTAAGGGASSTLAGCLRRAQMRLYRIDASTARAVLQDFRDACAGLDDRAFDRPGHKRKILNQLNGITPEECDFSHPFFWAPFVLVGHGGQTL
ncbi:CHAT domain-containing protein, partial [Chaetomium strumarium]